MKKLLSTLLISTAVFAGAQAVSADQDIVQQTTGDISVNGTLGVDNTDPGATIPEGDKDWINITVPTDAIFYNKNTENQIKSPVYNMTNKSGRPVKISIDKWTPNTLQQPLPANLDLNLEVAGGKVTTASTPLFIGAQIQAPTNELLTLANEFDQFAKTDAPAAAGTAVNNQGTFKFTGNANANTLVKLNYTLGLKFEAVKF
ncbi:hypothetical protein RyT2_04800 [Pseudolactococcus yaeyamensis]